MIFKRAFVSIFLLSFLCGCASSFSAPQKERLMKETENSNNEQGLDIYIPEMLSEGDTTLITYNGKSVLIDAGPSSGNGDELYNLLVTHVGNNNSILDYVIITHQDDDHLTQFSDSSKAIPRWLRKHGNKIGCLIDFDITMDDELKNSDLAKFLLSKDKDKGYSGPCKEYRKLRNYYLGSGKIKDYYPSTKFEGKKVAVDDDGRLELKILHNKYTSEKKSSEKSKITNSMSVCTLLTLNKEDKFLFTGDLIEYNSSSKSSNKQESGYRVPKSITHLYPERDLVQNNYEDLKDGVLFYKGGHHGSRYSNSSYLMDTIRPQHIAINAGKSYGFPHQMSLLNMTKWTDKIYIPGYYRYEVKEPELVYHKLLGDIHLKYDSKVDGKLYLEGDSNYSIFSSDMMNYDRMFAVSTYVLSTETNTNTAFNSTYVKLGHTDILIGLGYRNGTTATKARYNDFINKIKYLCNDGVLDYLIVPTNTQDYYGFLIENEKKGIDGLFKDGPKIKNIITHHEYSSGSEAFQEALNNYQKATKYDSVDCDGKKIGIPGLNENDFYIEILKQTSNTQKNSTPQLNSIATFIRAKEYGYLNMGSINDFGYRDDDNELLKNEDIKNKVSVLELPSAGYLQDFSASNSYKIKRFVEKVSNDIKVISSAAVSEEFYYDTKVFTDVNLAKLYVCKKYADGVISAYYNNENAGSADLLTEAFIGVSLEPNSDKKSKTKDEIKKALAGKKLRVNVRYNSFNGNDEMVPILLFKNYKATHLDEVHDSNMAEPLNKKKEQ